jgi:hypothetical protein
MHKSKALGVVAAVMLKQLDQYMVQEYEAWCDTATGIINFLTSFRTERKKALPNPEDYQPLTLNPMLGTQNPSPMDPPKHQQIQVAHNEVEVRGQITALPLTMRSLYLVLSRYSQYDCR